jgi:hypothetical protein
MRVKTVKVWLSPLPRPAAVIRLHHRAMEIRPLLQLRSQIPEMDRTLHALQADAHLSQELSKLSPVMLRIVG